MATEIIYVNELHGMAIVATVFLLSPTCYIITML